MYLGDANIVRAFEQGHPTVRLHLLRTPWTEIALPSVVVAEVLRGRCEAALKASPAEAPLAHHRLQDTQQMLLRFQIAVFDDSCVPIMERLRKTHRRRKRYADLMIAAMAEAGRHIVVTRNQGQYTEAAPLYHRALAIREKVFPDHPNTATLLKHYAGLLRKTNCETEAEKLEARAREVREKNKN